MSSTPSTPPLPASLLETVDGYLPATSRDIKEALFSSSLLQVCFATLRVAPYAFKAKEFGVNDFPHMLSSRAVYLEVSFISFASTIYHFAMSLLYTGIVILTIGFSSRINGDCGRHWAHIYYGAAGTGIGLVGTLVPKLGAYANLAVLYYLWTSLKGDYRRDLQRRERQLVQQIQNVVKTNRKTIYNYVRASVSEERYRKFFNPSLQYIEKRIEAVHRMDDIISLLIECKEKFPEMGHEKFNDV